MSLPLLKASLLDEVRKELAPPHYDRSVKPAIVHIGCGAFHRAHLAAYFDELLRQGEAEWLIHGVSLRSDTALRHLNPQDGFYSLVERDSDDCRVRIIGSIVDVLNPKNDPTALVSMLANPSTELVTLTITEKGYCVNPANGALDLENREIQADIANPSLPRTAPGFIVAGLRARRAEGGRPFTVLSCDNLSDNGGKTRRAMVELAAQTDRSLAEWIEREVAFPSSMVDRITPAVSPEAIANLRAITGYRDEAMVETEPFHQWVVEDWFSGKRPPLELAGVQMTSDVAAWESIKLRLLNGAHSSLAHLGGLLGYRYVHEAAADPGILNFIDTLWDEIEPTLPLVEDFDAAQYRSRLLTRFSNSSLNHRLSQIAVDGSQKLPQRLVQPLIERLRARQPSPAIELAIACWIRWQMGSDFSGKAHEVEDVRSEIYTTIISENGSDFAGIVRKVIETEIFGDAIPSADSLTARLATNLAVLSSEDAHDRCRQLLSDMA